METKNCSLQVKTITEAGEFEGLAAVYDAVDDGGDAISHGAFSKTLSEGSADLPLLWQHDQASPIGRVHLSDTPRGLAAKGRLVLSVPKAREVYTLMQDLGVVKGLSIGYKTIKEEMVGAVRRLKEIRLYELSIVTLPMQAAAQVTSVKQQADNNEALEQFRNAARDIKEFHRRMVDGD